MKNWGWSANVNGDHGQTVIAEAMRVNDAGALIFENESSGLYRTPVLFIAPGEWKSAWENKDE